jgi:hypothetical protein
MISRPAGGRDIMMGTLVRTFSPLPEDVSPEDLVPQHNFYRRLEARLDLSFVRGLAGPLYANGGRPSVDPVVFFKLQLVMFFEDIRSERRLMEVRHDCGLRDEEPLLRGEQVRLRARARPLQVPAG